MRDLWQLVVFAIVAVVVLSFWGGVGFVAYHFITKFW